MILDITTLHPILFKVIVFIHYWGTKKLLMDYFVFQVNLAKSHLMYSNAKELAL